MKFYGRSLYSVNHVGRPACAKQLNDLLGDPLSSSPLVRCVLVITCKVPLRLRELINRYRIFLIRLYFTGNCHTHATCLLSLFHSSNNGRLYHLLSNSFAPSPAPLHLTQSRKVEQQFESICKRQRKIKSYAINQVTSY